MITEKIGVIKSTDFSFRIWIILWPSNSQKWTNVISESEKKERDKERMRKYYHDNKDKIKRTRISYRKEEYNFLKSIAKANWYNTNREISEFIKLRSLSLSEKDYLLSKTLTEELNQVNKQLAKINSNINQLTKYTHILPNLNKVQRLMNEAIKTKELLEESIRAIKRK